MFGYGLDAENDYRKDNLDNRGSGLKLQYDAPPMSNLLPQIIDNCTQVRELTRCHVHCGKQHRLRWN